MPMPTKRDAFRLALEHKRPPFVPWAYGFTADAWRTLERAYGHERAAAMCAGCMRWYGSGGVYSTDIGNGRVRDTFGVVWNRSVDEDIGVIEGCVLEDGTLDNYRFPDTTAPHLYTNLDSIATEQPQEWRVYAIGFSLFERAWTLRGMENLLMDFYERPQFVHDLLAAIADYNITLLHKAVTYDIDAVQFGDDWGQQHGLIMGPVLWREFILPQLRRMYGVVKAAGKKVMIHSCGDVDEVFDDLVAAGLDCFNPFQPEVMDVWSLLPRYRGRLAFHGGLSTQKTLPYGTPDEVRDETRRLLALGRDGGYVFAPAHAVEGDVPAENMRAFIEEIQAHYRAAIA